MKRIVLAACVVAAMSMSGCKKDAKVEGGGGGGTTKTGTPTGTPTETPKPDEAKNPQGCNSDFAEPFVADVTLTEKCSPYTLKSGDLNVDGYALTIEPGVVVNLADNASFNVAYYKAGRLIVKGSKEKPVKFTGRTWKGLHFYKDAEGSSLENVAIENGGSEDSAALETNTHDLSINGVAISGAKKTALKLEIEKPLKGFSAVDLSKGNADPSELIHTQAATAGVFKSDLVLPEKSVIWVHGKIDADLTLVAVGAPYRVPELLNIDAPEGKSAGLTLKEGVTIELGENAGLQFGYYKGPAGLKIQGTKEKPVTLTRFGEDQAQTPSMGIVLNEGARAPEIDFLVLEYAGSKDRAAVFIENARGLGKITNSTFRHIKGEAIQVTGAKERFTSFDGNTFEDVEDSALKLPLELAHGLGAGNKFTDKARVTLFGDATKDTTLENVGAPYVVEGELKVNGDDTKTATLTIAAGNTLLFNDQGKISVSYYGSGKLVAQGTADKPIAFKKVLDPWQGIGVYGKGQIAMENVMISDTADDAAPLSLESEVTGTVKKVSLKATKKGLRVCTEKVKPEGVTADKGIKAVEKCD